MSTLLALGDYRFSINTAAHQSLRRQSSYRWQSAQRLDKRPALQFTGHGDETIILEGVIYPYFNGGLGQVKAMRAEAGQGQPLQMIDGEGHLLGLWCITEISQTNEELNAAGRARKITFSLNLKRYGDDLSN